MVNQENSYGEDPQLTDIFEEDAFEAKNINRTSERIINYQNEPVFQDVLENTGDIIAKETAKTNAVVILEKIDAILLEQGLKKVRTSLRDCILEALTTKEIILDDSDSGDLEEKANKFIDTNFAEPLKNEVRTNLETDFKESVTNLVSFLIESRDMNRQQVVIPYVPMPLKKVLVRSLIEADEWILAVRSFEHFSQEPDMKKEILDAALNAKVDSRYAIGEIMMKLAKEDDPNHKEKFVDLIRQKKDVQLALNSLRTIKLKALFDKLVDTILKFGSYQDAIQARNFFSEKIDKTLKQLENSDRNQDNYADLRQNLDAFVFLIAKLNKKIEI